ncbi:MAG: hypothetical protein ACYDA9_03170 [Terriglobia bacterium]
MRRLIPVLFLALTLACSPKQSSTPPQTTSPPASTSTGAPITATESAVAPEVSPPGDIPDTQAFVKYRSAAGGYELDVPEGWARTENGSAVTFVDKFDGVTVTLAPSSAAPTPTSVRANEVKQIQAAGRAVTVTNVAEVALPSGKAVLIKYASNSEPNPVTNKQVRLENEAYVLFKNGKAATLTLWAPQGADNVDQWRRMSRSFQWR